MANYLKAHAFMCHLPSIFSERLNPEDERVLRGRQSALNQATRWLLGRPAELKELVTFLVAQKLFNSVDNTEVTSRQEQGMRALCKFLKEPVPDRFTLEPCNSAGVLLHWKAVLLIVASLLPEDRAYWQKTFTAPEGYLEMLEEDQPASPEKILPKAFDAHFHLDRTLRELHRPTKGGTLDEILAEVPVDEDKQINLVGAVAIYCDPKTYPTDHELRRLPSHVGVGVGFHPRHARHSVSTTEADAHVFRRLLAHPRVIAFGEVGLDHTEPMRHWANQVDLLELILPALEDRHVLVLHCRGMDGDCGTEAFLLLLHFLRKHVRSRHPIHLHCFTGNQFVLARWIEVFPRTYFGFTNKVTSFDENQIGALQAVEENRLLIESDAPYFAPRGSRVSSPGQIYHVAAAIATHRHLTVERVLEITVANGEHLYHGQ